MVQIIPAAQQKRTFAQRLNEGVGRGLEYGQQMQQQKQMAEALKSQGIDPMVMNLPPEAQAAYFKQAFAQEKQLTPLQESQKNLNEERLRALQDQQNLFKQLSGQDSKGKPQGMLGGESESQNIPESGKNFLAQMPEENLNQLAAFAGQPGQPGIIGNIAKSEIEKRENKRKIEKSTFEGERSYHSGYSKKAEEEADQLRSSLPKKENVRKTISKRIYEKY